MLRIRLQRIGRKNQPLYRIVVAEHARAVKRKSIETIGHYNPTLKPARFVLNKTRYNAWLKKGARPTIRIAYLVERATKAAQATPAKK